MQTINPQALLDTLDMYVLGDLIHAAYPMAEFDLAERGAFVVPAEWSRTGRETILGLADIRERACAYGRCGHPGHE